MPMERQLVLTTRQKAGPYFSCAFPILGTPGNLSKLLRSISFRCSVSRLHCGGRNGLERRDGIEQGVIH